VKKLAKNIVAIILGWQVRRLTHKNDIKIVTVVGSIGKTSTKFAVATALSEKYKTLFQEGNYNDIVFVPLVIFEQPAPSLFNPFAWLRIFISNEIKLRKAFTYEVVVLELGTDAPGQIKQFGKYLRADITVITAITPEHMMNFEDLDAVAEEELSAHQFSKELLINKDLADKKYISKVDAKTFSISTEADTWMKSIKINGLHADYVITSSGREVSSNTDDANQARFYCLTAAAAVAWKFGLNDEQVVRGLKKIGPVSGRMRKLHGIKDSVILDDTYNASPAAVKAAIESLYKLDAPQKIALLGNMNELGKFSQAEHEEIGKLCDPKKLDLVVTLGPDANNYLAPSAEANGCNVKRFDDPYDAGDYIASVIKPGAIVLAKGSQNKVFAEEAVKRILANPKDSNLLVRQSAHWLKVKSKAFGK